jgi:hypothetical protein
MLGGRDSSECNCVGPIFLEGVDCLEDLWDRVIAQDSVFVLLGVQSTTLHDTQADVNVVTAVHQVGCSAGLGRAGEEACCKGLEPFRGMPEQPFSANFSCNLWLWHAHTL